MSHCEFRSLIADELERVEHLLHDTLTGRDFEQKVNALCQSVVSAGGKRTRPTLLLLCACMLKDLNEDAELKEKACLLAATVELLHTATLVHDDVIDNSPKRRGQDTLNVIYGNHVAVLAGDYLFTRCFALLQQLQSLKCIDIISRTVATLVTGEINQLEREGDLSLAESDYYHTIYCKTGALFEMAACAFALFIDAPEEQIEALKTYGRETGYAFQIADDILDYTADSATLGKDVGTDLTDGRVTLPVILALKNAQGEKLEALYQALENSDFAAVKAAIEESDALNACQNEALNCTSRAIKALTTFPDSPFKEALITIALKAAQRNH